MRPLLVSAVLATLAVVPLGGGWAKTGFSGPHGGPSAFTAVTESSGKGLRPVRPGHGRPWRRVPLYLDRDDGPNVTVTVRQVFAPTIAPVAFAVPSLRDLPASTGIRAARRIEPAVYVINDRPSSARRSGPKILDTDGGDEKSEAGDTPFGARIIHLTVPVGRP